MVDRKKPKLKVMKEIPRDDEIAQKIEIAEETGHQSPKSPTPTQSKDRPMTLTYTIKEKTNLFFGSERFFKQIFAAVGVASGKLIVKTIKQEQSSDPTEAVVKLVISKA